MANIDKDIEIDEELAAEEETNADSKDLLPKSSSGDFINRGPGGGGPLGGGRNKQRKVSRQNSKENVAAPGGAPGASCGTFPHAPRSWKNSRRSRNGFGRGLPKKGGAGGKGVWGLPGSELLEAYEDINDPNYDGDAFGSGDIELKVVIPDITAEDLRKNVEPIVLEYFENGDTHEAAISFEEIVPSNMKDALVQYIIEIAMDHKPSHREMTSVLISDLYGNVLSETSIAKGFENLLSNVTDLIIDIPDAPTLLGNFIARAIADDCIPPKFLTLMMDKSSEKPFQDAVDRANILFTMKHGIVRLHNVWGVGGALRPVKFLTRQMYLLLQEYLSSRDISEAARCVRALEVPHFHHELVYEAVVMALEANNANKEEALCTLLKALSDAVIITPDQLEQGFFRVFNDLPDISMDVPIAYIILDRFVERCSKERFLTDNIINRLPSRGRKRFVSEGDQQFFKTHKIS